MQAKQPSADRSQKGPRQSASKEIDSNRKTTPAEERGERIETGKIIARGGKSTGNVPGATEQS